MKTNLDSLFKTNKQLEQSGVWFRISPETRFLLRRVGGDNPHYSEAMAKYHKPHAKMIELNTLSDNMKVEILAKIFCDACLVSWEGVEIDGQMVECNFENGVKLFKQLPDLFDTLFKEASKLDSYKESVQDLGNF